jgi:hypothetical protein
LEDLATSSNNVAVAPTVNFLLGRQADGRKRRIKKGKIQIRFRENFIFYPSAP